MSDVRSMSTTLLRETAARATPGPWRIRRGNDVSSNVTARDEHMVIDGGGWSDGTRTVVYGAALNVDAAWIALASPVLAEPLADLIECPCPEHADAIARLLCATSQPVQRRDAKEFEPHV